MTQPALSSKTPFTLEVFEPYSTFVEGQPVAIPFAIDGLLPKRGFSIIGAKAKHGKSSMSRCEAVCVAKGQPFLDRETEQGEVLLCSLEDPRQHVDNHLQLLGYDPKQDARIHIVSRLARDVTQTVDAIAKFLAEHNDIKLVVLDTLGKVIRAKDSTNYDEMLELCEQLHLLARHSSGVHIQALAHCKKIQHEDPFDNFLGSVEIRAESDTNIVMYDCRGKRLIKTETRMGVPWDEHLLCADVEIVEHVDTNGKSSKTQMVKRFYLGDSTTAIVQEVSAAQEKNTRRTLKNGIVTMLKEHGGVMAMSECLDSVSGNRSLKFDMRDELIADGVIVPEGVAHSKSNPLKLRLLKPDWTANPVIISTPTEPTISPMTVTQSETVTLQPVNVTPVPKVSTASAISRDVLECRLKAAKDMLARRPDNVFWQAEVKTYEQQLGQGGEPCVN